MADPVCPPWLGYVLLNPLRRIIEDPRKMLGPFIHEGDTVLEPGCGMGYFTLPMARMVGENGRVIAVDMQDKMLSSLAKRAKKAGVENRIILHRARPRGMDLDARVKNVDFAVAIHMVHELEQPEVFFSEIRKALKPGGNLLVVEPKGHVSWEDFDRTRTLARESGFTESSIPLNIRGRSALFSKP
jgi:ubiquinone/menaquinone biosynthesis C-methylase UbiE